MPAVAIVPAHNEAPRVAAVIAPLLQSGVFTRVLVVDDGSTDDTAAVASRAGAHVLRLAPNRGKGGAMLAGLRATTEPVVAFFDADLTGLRPEHAWRLVRALDAPGVGQAVGLRDYGPLYNGWQTALPPITGERALRRDVLMRLPEDFWRGFRVETGINAVAARAGTTSFVWFWGVGMVPKWHKIGVRAGMLGAARMAHEVLTAMADAQKLPR